MYLTVYSGVYIQGWVRYLIYIQVPINQASFDKSSGRPSARCSVPGGWLGTYTSFTRPKNRSGFGTGVRGLALCVHVSLGMLGM
jgi:hypothetical protein